MNAQFKRLKPAALSRHILALTGSWKSSSRPNPHPGTAGSTSRSNPARNGPFQPRQRLTTPGPRDVSQRAAPIWRVSTEFVASSWISTEGFARNARAFVSTCFSSTVTDARTHVWLWHQVCQACLLMQPAQKSHGTFKQHRAPWDGRSAIRARSAMLTHTVVEQCSRRFVRRRERKFRSGSPKRHYPYC